MGLLDDFFGKDEINQLKKQLIEKTNEVTRLESSLSTLTNSQLAFEQKVAQLNKAVADGSVSHNALTMELAQSKAEIARQATEFESFKRTASDQKSQTSTTIAELQKTAAAFAPEIAAAKSERDAKANELQRLRAIYDEKDREYLGREAKLSEKSEKLLQERQKFQQQAMDLQIREQHWKHVIAPQISKYESHVSLDLRQKQVEDREAQLEQLERALSEREADMVRRQGLDETLKSREAEISEWNQLLLDRATELEAQTYKLDALSLELAAFRERAAQLDDEAARIEAQAEKIQAKEDEQQAKHAERLTELRQQRAEVRKTGKELNLRELDLKETGKKLNLRELDLKEREKTVNGEEALIQTMKNKNFQLRKEEKRLNALLEECEGEKQEQSSSKEFLLTENATLRSRIAELVQSAGKRTAVKKSDEIKIGEYDPAKHGGVIAQPSNFRSNTPLTALHYRVGLSGIDDADERRELLRRIISCSFQQLPKVGSPDYMGQWGEGKSPQRVRCMAYHLSWNIGFQGAKEENELARHHWLEDLKWLTKNYKARVPASKWPKVPTA
jgi:DNA repair exonuclease SbcCD ATPase subunit